MSQRFEPAPARRAAEPSAAARPPPPGPGGAVLRTRVIRSQARARSARVAAGDDVAVIPRRGETESVDSVAARAKRAGLAAMTMQGR